MPLIIIVGLPSSGKTSRTNELKEYFERQLNKSVDIVSDINFNIDKNDYYSVSEKEKELRGNLKSEVQKLISKESVLILDSLNYIKGFRYELYCVSKLCQTPQCILYTDVNIETCSKWNELNSEAGYKDEVLKALAMRFEAPETKNRWDSPLYQLKPEDKIPFEEIENSLFNKRAPPPNKSTLNKPLSDVNFLHDMDKITQDIVTYLVDLQKNQLAGDLIPIPNSTEKIRLIRPISFPELRKWRQQFLTYIKMHSPNDTSKISNMFVEYINNMMN